MVAIGYYGELIPSVNKERADEIFLVICKDSTECDQMVRWSGWQANFSRKDYTGGLYHFDETTGTICKIDANLATLIVALNEVLAEGY